jgi:glucose-6-phosphate 1-dehydrogenase
MNHSDSNAKPSMNVVPMKLAKTPIVGAAIPEAYSTLLLDAMRGDATLFTRGDEVEAEWRIMTPIEEACAIGSAVVPDICRWYQWFSGSRHYRRWRPSSVASPRTVGANAA